MVNFTSKTYQMKRERPAGSPPPVGFASFYRTITELRKILLFLCRSFPDSPVEIFPGNKIRQSNNRDPLKIFLTSIINSGYSILTPESL